eukprot:CAMPEP_0114540124 /NCGR_PEP_ID=MMETSP0114-20121206/599_1 /TAXON_ID=31324 /ORGANISM="Goniomonas sp, Strain m" /LENGTH=271 /DNA_ID=CAMNT_0001724263 /DNA_START=38 /DNA_END=849 /DNA_ORIENTATION=+
MSFLQPPELRLPMAVRVLWGSWGLPLRARVQLAMERRLRRWVSKTLVRPAGVSFPIGRAHLDATEHPLVRATAASAALQPWRTSPPPPRPPTSHSSPLSPQPPRPPHSSTSPQQAQGQGQAQQRSPATPVSGAATGPATAASPSATAAPPNPQAEARRRASILALQRQPKCRVHAATAAEKERASGLLYGSAASVLPNVKCSCGPKCGLWKLDERLLRLIKLPLAWARSHQPSFDLPAPTTAQQRVGFLSCEQGSERGRAAGPTLGNSTRG